MTFSFDGCNFAEPRKLSGEGNGPLAAVVNALLNSGAVQEFVLEDYTERSLGQSSDAKAIAFVGLRFPDAAGVQGLVYGCGIHSNIDRAAIAAIISALNRNYFRLNPEVEAGK